MSNASCKSSGSPRGYRSRSGSPNKKTPLARNITASDTGSPWRDVPERYGPWQTCYERWKRWDEDGTWARLLEHMQVKDDSLGTLDLEVVAIDS
jgi:hypothetical protein